MNTSELTKHIVEGLLGEEAKKDIAVLAGSFRPPTKSDYNLLLKALEQNPGLDEIHVFVGDSESEGLDQDDAVEIWKMFGNHFPRDFHVHKSEESPVSDVYAYASKFPTYNISWLFGVQPGNNDDFKKVADRTKNVNTYDNLSIRPVTYDDKTTEREVAAAAAMGTDELEKFLPKNLTYKEIDTISNMLKTKQLDEAMHQYPDDIINKITEEGWEYYETMGSLASKAAKVAKQARKENKKLFTLAYERDSSSDPLIQYINVFWADGGDPSRDVIEGGTMQDYEDIIEAGELNLMEVATDDIPQFEEAIAKIVDGGYTYLHISGAEKWMGEDVHEYLIKIGKKDNKKYFYIRDNGQDILIFFPDGERYPLRGISDDDLNDIIEAGSLNEVATVDLPKFEQLINKIVNEKYKYIPSDELYDNGRITSNLIKKSKELDANVFTITKDISGGSPLTKQPKQESLSIIMATPDNNPMKQVYIHNTNDQDLEDILDAADLNSLNEAKNHTEFSEYLDRLSNGDYYYVPALDAATVRQVDMRHARLNKNLDLDKPLFSYFVEEYYRRGEKKRDLVFVFSDHDKGHYTIAEDIDDNDLEDLQQAVDLFTEPIPARLLKEATNQPRFEELVNKIADGDYYYLPAEDLDSLGRLEMRQVRYDHDYDIDKPMFSFALRRGLPIDIGARFSDEPDNQFWILDATEEEVQDLRDAVEMFTSRIPKEKLVLKEAVEFEYDPVHGLDHYEDLMRYMSSNGLNIEPYPEIKFVDDDQENAEDLFGKTAYYDPNSKTVVLYTFGRHPKDILRSFAHELVHVHQDNEGRIGNIQTTNTNEDDDLVELEKEAYLKGNMMFRQWTDSLKEGKKKYGINAYAAELARLREGKGSTEKVTKIYCDINDVLAGTDTPDVQWTDDGRKLWSYLFTLPVPVTLLSSTTNQDHKEKWISQAFHKQLTPKVIFRRSHDKHEFSEPGAVLIDNKKSTIDEWNEKGGIGIHHDNAKDTMLQLKKLGL